MQPAREARRILGLGPTGFVYEVCDPSMRESRRNALVKNTCRSATPSVHSSNGPYEANAGGRHTAWDCNIGRNALQTGLR
jgi:hypothetical protein